MGAGDRKTKRGKIRNASYGNIRSHASVVKKAVGTAAAPAAKKTATKSTAKKTVAKKAG